MMIRQWLVNCYNLPRLIHDGRLVLKYKGNYTTLHSSWWNIPNRGWLLYIILSCRARETHRKRSKISRKAVRSMIRYLESLTHESLGITTLWSHWIPPKDFTKNESRGMKTFSGYLGYRTSNHDFWKEFVWFIQRDFFLKLLQHGKGKKNPLKSICFHSNMWLYMISSASTDLGSPRELLGQKKQCQYSRTRAEWAAGFDDLGRVWVADNAGMWWGSVKDSKTLLNCAATFVANIGLSCGEKLKAVPHMGEREFQLIRSKRSSRVAAANSSVPTMKFREPVTPVTLWLFSELRTGKPPLKW